MVVVGRRPGAPRYDFEDDDSLAAACRVLAAIVRNRQLTSALEESLADLQVTNEELRRSRTRIVTAADAERRRIERNLHDGAQQHLLALAVTVGLVRQMVAEGEPAAEIEAMLGQLGDDVNAAIGQVRELAQGIYPALLMDGGLEAGAARCGRPRADEGAGRRGRCGPLPAEPRGRRVLLCARGVAERRQARTPVDGGRERRGA